MEFKCILFIPKSAPFDLFETTGKNRNNIKLYVKSVFVTDESDDLIPEWLRFIKGVVDSYDLPLTISRENLQQNSIMKVIKKTITKRSMELMKSISEDNDKYKEFYTQYSKSIKLGIHEDSTHRSALSSLLRYTSTKSNGELIGFSDYIKRMNDDQKNIYYITGDENVKDSPFLEKFIGQDIEVIYMNEPMDEYCMQQLKEFEDKKLVCITKGEIKFTDDDEEQNKEKTELFTMLCDFFIKIQLGDKVEKVIISNKLVDILCILSTAEHGWSSHMKKIMRLQALRDTSMNKYMLSKTFEINPNSKLINGLKDRIEKDENDKVMIDLVQLLYQSALLSSGFDLDNPGKFTKRLYNIIECGLNLDDEFN